MGNTVIAGTPTAITIVITTIIGTAIATMAPIAGLWGRATRSLNVSLESSQAEEHFISMQSLLMRVNSLPTLPQERVAESKRGCTPMVSVVD